MGGATEAIHDGDTEADFAEGLGDDGIEFKGVESAEGVEETDGGFTVFAFTVAEGLDVFPFVEVDVAFFSGTAVGEEAVFFAFFGGEVGRFVEEVEGGVGGVVGGELAGTGGCFLRVFFCGEMLRFCFAGADNFAEGLEFFLGDGAGAEEGKFRAFGSHG